MSERVAEFLIMLSKDPVKLDAFLDDPGPLLRESALTGEEQDLLLSGDSERIRSYVGENAAFAAGASTTSMSPPPNNPPPNNPPPNNPPPNNPPPQQRSSIPRLPTQNATGTDRDGGNGSGS